MKKTLVIGLALLASAMLAGCIETGRGSVTDTPANLETQGLIFKTTELYLTNDHDAFYCVNSELQKLTLQSMIVSKPKLTLEYTHYLFMFPWECSWGNEKYSNAGVITHATIAG